MSSFCSLVINERNSFVLLTRNNHIQNRLYVSTIANSPTLHTRTRLKQIVRLIKRTPQYHIALLWCLRSFREPSIESRWYRETHVRLIVLAFINSSILPPLVGLIVVAFNSPTLPPPFPPLVGRGWNKLFVLLLSCNGLPLFRDRYNDFHITITTYQFVNNNL